MNIFGKLVKTTINVAVGLPVAVVADIFTLGNVTNIDEPCHTAKQLELIKKEASE